MKKKMITTRVDPQFEYEIAFIKNTLGFKSTTLVLKEAVHSLYSSIQEFEAKKSPFEMFEEAGLIGCLDGPTDLSTNYKNEISEYISEKHYLSNKNPKTKRPSKKKSK